MALSSPDLIMVAVIREALEFLSNNPKHLEFILSSFNLYPGLKKIVGAEHIKQCVEYVTKNRIEVAPFYEIDLKRRPSIVVIASGVESEQFIGDYGTQQVCEQVMPPYIYAEWDAKAIEGDVMKVARTQGLQDKLWPGIVISNGTYSVVLDGILVRDGHDTELCFKQALPTGLSLKGWKAQSSEKGTGVVVSASIDDVTIQVKLTTNGDFAIHRLLGLVVRYAIKSRRLLLDEYGIQVASLSYSPPMSTDSEEHEFESVYTVSGKYVDHWIEKEFDLNDSAGNVIVEGIAHSENPENVDVNLSKK